MVILLTITGTSQAQPDEVCFQETPHCIAGRFRQFWQQNGGLPVFGYPITPVATIRNPDTNKTHFVQWFERHRLEVYPDNPPPYDVLLGRVGSELLAARGVDWWALPPADGPLPDCIWFEQTGHNLCNQLPGTGFKSYWERYGLQDPALSSYEQSLALFGLPLTEAYAETKPDGRLVLVQWFERARFEWYPLNPPPYNVLPGLLGAEIRAEIPIAHLVDGLWQGQTSQLQRVLLTMDNGALQAVVSDIMVRGEHCVTPYRYVRSAFTDAGIIPVTGNTFAATIEDAETVFTIRGTFESDTIASGSIDLITKPVRQYMCSGSGSVTWRAERRADTPPPAALPEPVSAPAVPPAQPVVPVPAPVVPVVPSEPVSVPDNSPPGGKESPELIVDPVALCLLTPDPATAPNTPIRIVEVDKAAEVALLENTSDASVDLTDWTLCSINGGEVHEGIRGIINGGDEVRQPHTGSDIWLDDEKDDGALYDAEGNLVSYWDDPAN